MNIAAGFLCKLLLLAVATSTVTVAQKAWPANVLPKQQHIQGTNNKIQHRKAQKH